jgi:hypothetical protein
VSFDKWFANRFPVIDSLSASYNGTRSHGMKAEDALDVRKACEEAWNASKNEPELCVDEGCPQFGTAHVCNAEGAK